MVTCNQIYFKYEFEPSLFSCVRISCSLSAFVYVVCSIMKPFLFLIWFLLLLSSFRGLLALNITITYTLILVLPSLYHLQIAKSTPSNYSLSRTLSYATSNARLSPEASQALITTRSMTRYSTTIVTVSPLPYTQSPTPLSFTKPYLPSLVPPTSCRPRSLFCINATKFSVCAQQASHQPSRSLFVYQGAVAPGTICRNNRIVRTPDGKCTPIDKVTCRSSGQIFFACAEGGVISFGKLSPQTRCVGGGIFLSARNEKLL